MQKHNKKLQLFESKMQNQDTLNWIAISTLDNMKSEIIKINQRKKFPQN